VLHASAFVKNNCSAKGHLGGACSTTPWNVKSAALGSFELFETCRGDQLPFGEMQIGLNESQPITPNFRVGRLVSPVT
jgi:hypothetical protein